MDSTIFSASVITVVKRPFQLKNCLNIMTGKFFLNLILARFSLKESFCSLFRIPDAKSAENMGADSRVSVTAEKSPYALRR